jgi:UDP-2-acetamido-3-amino-2,3-dideoxy-glucuronate N-acetyltransferase
MIRDAAPPSIHPSAVIDGGASIGAGTKIWHFCHVMPNASIGERCSLGQNVFIATRVRIGDNVKIQNNVSVYEGVTLEDDVFCGPSMVFTNVRTPRSHVPRNAPADFARTLVRRGASIGANATVVCRITIGEYAFIGAGSVVTHDVPPYALAYGNPARVLGYACSCGQRLRFAAGEAVCTQCERAYRADGDLVMILNGGAT